LRRTRIGPFRIDDAADPEGDLAAALIPPAVVAGRLFPTATMEADAALALGQGKRVAVAVPDAPTVAAIGPDGSLIGLISVREGLSRVLVNFPTPEGT
jgi:tRNA pseudouridine55 synthase